MTKSRAAVAGGSKPLSPSLAPKPTPAAAPVTTRKDIEQNTYTSERSEQLREGNTASR